MPDGASFKSDYDGCWYYKDNIFTADQWNVLEKQGAVFLPAGGGVSWNGSSYDFGQKYNRSGFYWTDTKIQNGNGEDRGTTMEFGGYSNTSNDLPIFVQREIVNERRGIRLCYEIHSDD